jgi:hypothetical protein
VEDRDSERLTDVVNTIDHDDDPIGMWIGPGTEVGGYIVDGELGHGGEAEVAREAFRTAKKQQRDALIAFLETL